MDACRLLLLLSAIMMEFAVGVKDVPIHKIEALKGETIYLPCNVSTFDGDEIALILWYREDKGTPIYSVDVRGSVSKAAKRWSDETVFGERAYFMFDKEPGRLSIQNTQDSDTGIYRCRIDFMKAQTQNSRVELTVVAPPSQIIIRDETNAERSTVVGPYSEGDILSLKCEALGGKPLPNLIWYRDGIQSVSETRIGPGANFVVSEITLGPLGREDLNSRLTCRASNHLRAPPLETVVQVDMNFAPLNIRLLGARQPLSAGRRYDLLCQSAGSRPPAAITWWMNGIRLEKTTETTSSDGNQTTSTLSITLSKSDTGKYLACKAYNHAVPTDPLEDGWKLDIQYVPEAYVRLGTSLDPDSIREGTDVYFDCLVIAHPPVYRIEWRHNGRVLPHNVTQGVIISNHSLVLQGVTRSTAGNYTCVGYNGEGEGPSPPFRLNILYAPTCVPNQLKVYGVAKQEDAKIKCTVDANPPEVDFTWTFNNSAESIDVATNHIARLGTSSTVTYTPITELDYGTLLCIAANKIGRQRIPCIFHIIAAGRPDQVHNCTLVNISLNSLTVTCSDGFNGGMAQMFILEARDVSSNEIKANITSSSPRFIVSSLAPGSVLTLTIYAFNAKGRSDPTIMTAPLLRMPEKQLTSERENPRPEFLFSPVVSLSVGLSLAVMVAGLAVILALRIPCNSSRRRQKERSVENVSRENSPGPSEKSCKELDGNESDDKNPDVIPESIDDSDDQDSYIRRRQHVSTIDTSCNPSSRGILSNTTPHSTFNSSGMTLHTSHNTGYCTLRNGGQAASSISTLPMNVTPHIYSNSIAQCTLPRHTGQHHLWYGGAVAGPVRHMQPLTSLQHHQLPLQSTAMSTATGKAAHVQVQMPIHAEIVSTAAAAVGSSSSSSSASNNNAVAAAALCSTMGRTIALQHMNQAQKGISIGSTGSGGIGVSGGGRGICVSVGSNGVHSTEPTCLSDDEITVHTPLMVKRESTV